MRKLLKKTAKDLSSFENYKVNNLKVIIGGLGDGGDGDIDPKKPQPGNNGGGTGTSSGAADGDIR